MFYHFFDCSFKSFSGLNSKKARVLIIYNDDGIVALHMASQSVYLKKQNEFFSSYKNQYNLLEKENKAIEQVVCDYLLDKSDGKKLSSIKINWSEIKATDFQKSVLQELVKINFGEAKSYKQIATNLDSKAYRAVGSACGKNPIMLFIPCHRVLASGGKLGGFASGLKLKQDLLQIESIGYKK